MKICTIALAAAGLTVGSAAQAQLLRSVGVKAGPVLSRQELRYPDNPTRLSDFRHGTAANLSLEWFNLLNHLSVVSDLGFVQKGGSLKFQPDPQQPDQYEVALGQWDYAALSLLLRPRVQLGALQLYALAGPRFEYLFSTNKGLKEAGLGDPRLWMSGYTLGGGLEVKVWRLGVLAEAQLLRDFTAASDFPAAAQAGSASAVYNRAVAFKGGVKFYLKD